MAEINKVVYGGNTIMDLTSDTVTPEVMTKGTTALAASGAQIVGIMTDLSQDTVTPETLAEGVTAHDASGQKITGTMKGDPNLLINNQTVTFSEQGSVYVAQNPFVLELVEGATYEVTWDGEVYTDVAFKAMAGDGTVETICLGDEDSSFTNYPFVLQYVPSMSMLILACETESTHVISVTKKSDPVSVKEKDINFYDYDGTRLYSYTFEEAAALSELPPLPESPGLVCQGWNYDIADITSSDRPINVGAMYITNDGKTRLYICLEEGRTSPCLGLCIDGTITVDWGDGTIDVLTGTSTSTAEWTSPHDYDSPGEYVITLEVTGTMSFYGFSSSYNSYILNHSNEDVDVNRVYLNTLTKLELGSGITTIGYYAFSHCHRLSSITIPDGVRLISSYAFYECNSLSSVVLPKTMMSIGSYAFYNCSSLSSIFIPKGVTSIETYALAYCRSLSIINIPEGVTSITNRSLYYCESMSSIAIPSSVTSIEAYAFYACRALSSVVLPSGVTSIGDRAFYNCYNLSYVIVPETVTSIGGYAFYNAYGVSYYDFTNHTSVPTLNTNVFPGIADDCLIRVPAALVDDWKAATNWASYSSHIVGV